MSIDSNTKGFIACIPWVLPIYLLLPYAVVASGFQGLIWVWETRDLIFWLMLGGLVIAATISSALLFRLQASGLTLFRVGVLAVHLQATWLAMSERRHLLLLLVFAMFSSAVFLSEKIRRVLRLPFYDSKRSWWESYPKGLPGLSVEVLSESGDNAICRLSNFGSEGCFVFSTKERINFTPRSIRIMSADKVLLDAEVVPLLQTSDGFGWGLRFSDAEVESDWTKDLQDYLGFLRRSGYEIA